MPKDSRDLMWFLGNQVKPATRARVGKTFARMSPGQHKQAFKQVDELWKVKGAAKIALAESEKAQFGRLVSPIGGITHREAAADVIKAVRKVARDRPPSGVSAIVGQARHSAKWLKKYEGLEPKYRSAVGYAAKQAEDLSPRARAATVLKTIRAVEKKSAKPPGTLGTILEFVGAGAFERRRARERQQL